MQDIAARKDIQVNAVSYPDYGSSLTNSEKFLRQTYFGW